jgi:hypothetical protein
MSLDAYTRRKLLTAPLLLLVCIVVLEVSVRLLCHVDEDGDRWFEGVRLKPYHLPVQRISTLVRGYEAARGSRSLFCDPDLGWVPPGDWGASSYRRANSASGRGSSTLGVNCLRIAVFGASYTAGWWQSLEDSLNAAGIPTQVVNFGCGGYGMDQALLRWRKHGVAFRPNVVLFGFSRGDCENNLSLLRLLSEPESGIPFLKPRFVLRAGRLQLINAPTPPLGEVPGIVSGFGRWPVARYEHYYQPADFRSRLWRHSVVLSLLEARITAAREREAVAALYAQNGEVATLTLSILRQFRAETEATGSCFYVVHLPHEDDLQALQDNGSRPFPGLLDSVSGIAPVIMPDSAMLDLARGHALSSYFARGHYAKEFNSLIGRTITKALIASRDSVHFRRLDTSN